MQRPLAAEDPVRLLTAILARLISIEGLLRSQHQPRPQPIDRLVGYSGGAPRASRAEPTQLRATPAVIGRIPLEGAEALGLKRKHRKHTEADKARDREQLKRWLYALDMGPGQAAKAAKLNTGTLSLVMGGSEGLSERAETAMRALLTARGITED